MTKIEHFLRFFFSSSGIQCAIGADAQHPEASLSIKHGLKAMYG